MTEAAGQGVEILPSKGEHHREHPLKVVRAAWRIYDSVYELNSWKGGRT